MFTGFMHRKFTRDEVQMRLNEDKERQGHFQVCNGYGKKVKSALAHNAAWDLLERKGVKFLVPNQGTFTFFCSKGQITYYTKKKVYKIGPSGPCYPSTGLEEVLSKFLS